MRLPIWAIFLAAWMLAPACGPGEIIGQDSGVPDAHDGELVGDDQRDAGGDAPEPDGGDDEGADEEVDPCYGVECGPHGHCEAPGGEPRCVCDDGYIQEDGHCVLPCDLPLPEDVTPDPGAGVPFGYLDIPEFDSRTTGVVRFFGWVLCAEPIEQVTLFVDGQDMADLPLDVGRSDVCAAFPAFPCDRPGFHVEVDLSGLSQCHHIVEIRARTVQGDTTVVDRARLRIIPRGNDRPTLGVQRWDMYSGKGATQEQELGYLPGAQGFLRPAEWHHRAPFFCRRTADVDWINHPGNAGPLWFNYPFDQQRLQNAMNQEIAFAAGAGIDYFIFNGPTRTLFSNGWELHNNLDAYLASPLRSQVNFVFALFGADAIDYGRTKVNRMLDEIIGYMRMPEWQTVKDGRPLVPVLFPMKFKRMLESQADPAERMTLAGFVGHIRQRVQAAGLPNPYVVGEEINHCFNVADQLTAAGFDAMADYQGGYGGGTRPRDEGPTYAQATQGLLNTYDIRFLGAMKFIPPMPNQLYQWPRAEGDETHHYCLPLPGDVAERIRLVFDYVVAHPEDCDAQTVFMYSWNEHSEGGGLCPTMGASPGYQPVTEQLDEVGDALMNYVPNPDRKNKRADEP